MVRHRCQCERYICTYTRIGRSIGYVGLPPQHPNFFRGRAGAGAGAGAGGEITNP